MVVTKIKWMVLGMAIAITGAYLYNNFDLLKVATGSRTENGIFQKINPEFATYIRAFTAGHIPTGSKIRIKFTNPLKNNVELNKPVEDELFEFEPAIEGSAVWKDGQTIEFTPKERLKPGQLYNAKFNLSKLISVKEELKEFPFAFKTIKQSLQFQVNELRSYNSNDFDYYSLSGSLSTADFVEPSIIEKTLNANLNSTSIHVKWNHNETGTIHSFVIDSIQRPNTNKSLLKIGCDAKELGLELKESKSFDVPAKGEFQLLDVQVKSDNEQYVLLNFSNPIDPDKRLEGLINLGNHPDIKYLISNNQVFIYPNELKSGSYKLNIESGIRDTKGNMLNTPSEHEVVFTDVKPAVRFFSSGNILPSSNNLQMPFETVNLRAVDVKIIKIYENNVLQFLQTNDMDGGSSLAQVGKKVVEKRINLGITNPADFGVWKKFTLDLADLIKTEPGAIYRISLGFKKSYSTYPCLGNSADESFEMDELSENTEDDVNYFGYYYYDDYYSSYDDYYEYEDYDWRDRDNPCKSAYYRQYQRTVSRNIIASDIGLTLKKGNDGNIFIVANNLIDTKPMKDVELEFYDYQKQLIHTATTNSDGQLFVQLKNKAAFVVAKKEQQRAYLRLDDGNSLSLSLYDVSGETIKKGLKGFIYGERGVWRPGDTLFLNFILEDKQALLPENHPVVFELQNPQGQITKRLFSNSGTDGFYNFTVNTDMNAPTGLWNAVVKVGSVKFYKALRIESIMPNRLKIKTDVGDNKLIKAGEENNISINATWLTGAKISGYHTTMEVMLRNGETSFPKFKDYIFRDATIRYESEKLTLFDDKLDENGNANFPFAVEKQQAAPGFLTAQFTTRVFEPGGAFSVDRFSMPVSPYEYYVGLKVPKGESFSGILQTGKDHQIQIATCDQNGKPVSRGKLKFELYKLEWRWWWDQYQDELANYTSDEYHRSVMSEYVSSSNGKASIKVNVKDNEWGRYLIRVIDTESGHASSTVAYFDWPNWRDRDGGDGENKLISNALQFTTDKTSYKTGEEVTLNIPSPEKCRALLTIENGSRVIEAHWLETEKGNTLYKFKVTPEMSPNVYVHISLLQPHARANDLPIRMYGVVPITVDDPETHLRPKITMSDELVPEQNVSIQVSEENGKEMAFTIAMVDEGLLDITRFKTPNPWDAFYSREALGVKTFDLYDQVIGAFGADLERVLSIGGDGTETGEDGAKANRFKPMVRFFGPFHVDKKDKKTISFKMPKYVGSVRTMVIAGYKGAYGSTEKTTAVKAPLMILGTLPRVLSINEEVKVPVSVFGGSKAIGQTQIKISTNDLVKVAVPASKNISLKKDEEKLVDFTLKVKSKTGIAKVTITATGGGHTSTYEMELDVRNPNPYQTSIKDFWVEAGKNSEQNITPFGVSGTNKSVLELSTIPSVNLDDRLNYLITYPHGCIEQTTSGVFAQLFLNDILNLTDEQKADVDRNIKIGISQIQKFQLSNGGMAYWQGMNQPNEWGSIYACHFLTLADKKGYSMPGNLKKDLVSFEKKEADNFKLNKTNYFNNDIIQAYRLYVLSLANSPSIGRMNQLREYANLSTQARWLLASAYAQIGQADEAQRLITNVDYNVNQYRYNPYTYGSSDRDQAMILDALCLLNKKSQAFTQLKKVASTLSSKSWMSTQTTAYCLVSVANFIKKFGGSSAMQAQLAINKKGIQLKGNSAIAQVPITYASGKANISITNKGGGTLFARIINRGKPPIGNEEEANENITVNIQYKDMNGNSIDVDELEQGKNFMMTVTVKNLGYVGELTNLALSNYIPSGWEIHNSRMDNPDESYQNVNYTYQDIRDDKVLTYFDLGTHESKTFSILLNSTYEGKFYLPAVNVEAMYDNSVYARTKGKWIHVVKQLSNDVAGK